MRLIQLACMLILATTAAQAADPQVTRGRYLVSLAGCNDCHTPGNFLGHRDMTKVLGGSDVGFGIPGLGVFVGPNLTPDKETGLGKWSPYQIVTAIRTGKRPDGRVLAPIMPWHDLAHLTDGDAFAIAAYLKSLPAVSHKVPGPFGPNDVATVPVMAVQPPEMFATLKPPPH